MAYMQHQNKFGTNVTSNQVAGVTTTPLNSIPSVAAPFYIALDATNTNSHYEVVHVTSKTATNINHAATSYAHSTDEEVRMVVPGIEMDVLGTPPQGHMFNGKLSVTVSSNDLIVAVKTLAGADPSVTDPIWVRIGDTMRAITAALSVTAADGTNWMDLGAAAFATVEQDLFAYLGYNATDGVVLGFSRIPYARQYGDFSATTTNETYAKISTITTAASTDYYEVIGRFAATLSAGAGYTWTVPTFTALNLIQTPIRETRHLTYDPKNNVSNCTGTATYKITNDRVFVAGQLSFTGAADFDSTHMPRLPLSAVSELTGNHVSVGTGGYEDSGASNEPNTLSVNMETASLATLWTNGGAILSSSVPVIWANGDKVYFRISGYRIK